MMTTLVAAAGSEKVTVPAMLVPAAPAPKSATLLPVAAVSRTPLLFAEEVMADASATAPADADVSNTVNHRRSVACAAGRTSRRSTLLLEKTLINEVLAAAGSTVVTAPRKPTLGLVT